MPENLSLAPRIHSHNEVKTTGRVCNPRVHDLASRIHLGKDTAHKHIRASCPRWRDDLEHIIFTLSMDKA